MMPLGCIADDLTGATDLGVTLAREGLSVIQVNGVPDAELRIPDVDAVVVALKSRTNPPQEAVDWSLRAQAWLHARGAQRCYFKYCSTFDSTPRGNIGPVMDALMEATGSAFTVATPAYPLNKRTVYLGHLFVGHQLLSDSGMRNHPLTPMTDANLLRLLGAQARGRVGLIPFPVLDAGAAAVTERCAALQDEGYSYAILDAVRDEHLVAAGAACFDMPLTTGGAGLGMGLARALAQRGGLRARGELPMLPKLGSGAVVLSGSCSEATLAQVAAARERYPAFKLDPMELAKGSTQVDAALDWAGSRLGALPVMIYASAPPERVVQVCAALGDERAAKLVEDAFRNIVRGLIDKGVRRFVVAGGETAGAVVEATGVRVLSIGPEIAPGVPWTQSVDGEPFQLALKSGNFGQRDFFLKAFEVLQ